MRSFWSDPYLWIHLAGLAALPIWLELCFLGLAVGDPIFPVWLELAFVAIAGIAPILWMQWQRPFYIFSLLVIALKPEKLTLPQRQLLTRFKSTQNRLLAVIVAVLLAIVLRQLYVLAPIGATAVPFSIESRGLGLVIAAIAFLGSNLFLQVPVSVASVMLTSDAAFGNTEPYPLEKISQDFTKLGLPVSQLLPETLEAPAIASPARPSPPKSESAVEAVDLWAGDRVTPPAEVTPSSPLESASPLESGVAESVLEESTELTSEAEGGALEELIVDKQEVEIEAETVEAETVNSSTEVADLPAVNVPTESDNSESGDEVEHEPADDLDEIARIDQQSATEISSAEISTIEESDTTESDPLE